MSNTINTKPVETQYDSSLSSEDLLKKAEAATSTQKKFEYIAAMAMELAVKTGGSCDTKWQVFHARIKQGCDSFGIIFDKNLTSVSVSEDVALHNFGQSYSFYKMGVDGKIYFSSVYCA